MDTKALESRIVDAVRPILEEFRAQPSEAEAKHAAALDTVRASIEAADDPVVKRALKMGLAKLEKDGPEKEDRSADEAKAWNAAARRVGITTRVGRARTAAGNRVRRSRKAVEDAAEKVRDTLEDAVFMTKSEIAEKTDLAEGMLKSAIARLKREGEIESNGQRGRAGGWRKASED